MLVAAPHLKFVGLVAVRSHPKFGRETPRLHIAPLASLTRNLDQIVRVCNEGKRWPDHANTRHLVAHIGAAADCDARTPRGSVLFQLHDRGFLSTHFGSGELAVYQRPNPGHRADESSGRTDQRGDFLPFHGALQARRHQSTASAELQYGCAA